MELDGDWALVSRKHALERRALFARQRKQSDLLLVRARDTRDALHAKHRLERQQREQEAERERQAQEQLQLRLQEPDSADSDVEVLLHQRQRQPQPQPQRPRGASSGKDKAAAERKREQERERALERENLDADLLYQVRRQQHDHFYERQALFVRQSRDWQHLFHLWMVQFARRAQLL